MLIGWVAFRISVRSVAVLSLHTSPLVQPGAGDSGGMNVYVRELVSALAQAGVDCTTYVRRWRDDLPEVVAGGPPCPGWGGWRRASGSCPSTPAGPTSPRKTFPRWSTSSPTG